ncbi:hypothetical protein BJX70DRAFT_409089 [Aspergillus crustosus]
MWSRYSRLLVQRPSPKWDFIGDSSSAGNPAWLLYLQPQFRELDDCRLASANVELTFEETVTSRKQRCRPSKMGPVFTEYYGPQAISGNRSSEPDASLGVDSISKSTILRSERYSKYPLESSPQWSLNAYTWPVEGDESGLHGCVEWDIKEGYPQHAAILNHNRMRVGIVLRHDSDPFFITVRLEGQLKANRGWFKFSSPIEPLPSSRVRVSPSKRKLVQLDDITERLNEDMTALALQRTGSFPRSPKRPAYDEHPETSSASQKRTRLSNCHPVSASPYAERPRTTQRLREDYTIGWVCALPIELAAAKAMLDSVHDALPTPSKDPNNYTLGEIRSHNIVLVCLPIRVYGPTSAAIITGHMTTTFLSTIAGGKFKQTGTLNKPPQVIKHGKTCNPLAKQHNVLCFEMEAAGTLDNFPYLIIYGIRYAAAVAAVYAKEFILMTPI